jgi:diguanylate cyclase (GGDEF)-like protein
MLIGPNHTRCPVLGVLTPHTGGFYYGTVINGILRAARELGAVAIAFETSRLHLLRGREVVSSAWVDGWLAINEFADPELMAVLRARGKPIIHVHSQPDTKTGAVALPDNEGGMRALTEHLISHGHQRLAFAGNLGHVDIAGRYAGYRAALEAAGIRLEERLVFDTPHHKEVDGRRVALRLLELRKSSHEPLRATALVAATDRLALGAMATLQEAGLTLPADFAIVGFDDADAAQFAEPPLTTVRQNFAEVAGAAVSDLLAAIRGDHAPTALLRVPTKPILRRSCGCLISHTHPPNLAGPRASRGELLTSELLRVASRTRRVAMNLAEWPEARELAQLLDAAASVDAEPPPVRGGLWSGFLADNRDAEGAVRAVELLESTLRAWDVPEALEARVRAVLRDLCVSLLHQWQRSERTKVAHYESVTEAAYRLANALSESRHDPAEDLSWVRWSSAQHACSALWTAELPSPSKAFHTFAPLSLRGPHSGVPRLQVRGEYTAEGGSKLHGNKLAPISAEQFPPESVLQTALREGSIVTIASVPSGRDTEFGLLAVVAPLAFEQLEYVGTPGDWAVHLGTALERSIVERKLRANAELDALTGLANRSTLLERVEELRSAKSKPGFALLFIDLDDFKKVNDSLGHEAGDQLLVQIAERLMTQVAARDEILGPRSVSNLVARVGGDEFVMVLLGVDDESAMASVAEQLQTRLKQPYIIEGSTVFVSASIGVTFSRGLEASAQELLRDADTAMYRAKMKGRARHEVFHHRMHTQAVEKLHLDAQLRAALVQNEFELFYQPIVELDSGTDIGAEALIRWRHPEHGLLVPGRFLAVAEEVGLAVPMSEWVIRRACSEAGQWNATRGRPLYVNVNVPAAHIKQPGFVAFIEAALEEARLNPRSLGIELVESALLDDPTKTATTLVQLRAMGVRIAIDDFGTGYSSLSYLRDFPVHTLKIDRSFVKNVPGNVRDNGITRAIIAMGEALGLSLVAEGIETLEQYQLLREMGCHAAQGYFMCKPIELGAYRDRISQFPANDATPNSSRDRLPRIRDMSSELVASGARMK